MSYLRKKFKESFGISISEYRENFRIQKAKRLLLSHEPAIKEIAALLGYCDVYHFSKCFKKVTGITPAKYGNRGGIKND